MTSAAPTLHLHARLSLPLGRARARAPRRAGLALSTAALALLGAAAGCAEDTGRMDGLVEGLGGDDGKLDFPGRVEGTCLQFLADGNSLEQVGCTADRVLAEFRDSPLGQVATLSQVQPVRLESQPDHTYLDLLLCDAPVSAPDQPLWRPLQALWQAYAEQRRDAYGDPGPGCQWVPAEDFVGVVFLYLHNTYEPTPLTEEAAWRFFHHYPDTVTYLFGTDPNFSFSFVNRHLQYYLDHHETDYEWVQDLVDAYVVSTWNADFADVIIVNNSLNMMPTTIVPEELVGEFTPPVPNRVARQTLQAMNDAWNGENKLLVRLDAIIGMSELGVPFAYAPQATPLQFRPLNQLQGTRPLAAAVDPQVLPPNLNVALLDGDAYRSAWLGQADPVTGFIATTADFDFFYEQLMAEGRIDPDVVWRADVLDDVEGRASFHLEYVLGQANPAETAMLESRGEVFVNGRAVGPIAQTAPNAPRGVLFEELFHTGQVGRPTSFSDPLNYDQEIEFRQYALDNAARYGFDNNPDQLAIWRHDKAIYEMLRDMARHGG